MPELRQVPLCDIDEPDRPMRSEMDDQKLEELCWSMQKNGQLQPIGVKSQNGRYMVEYGHRRTIAAKRLGWASIAALVYGPDEQLGKAQMFAENMHREDVNDADTALWIAERVEQDKWDEETLCRETGKKPDWIGDRFRLLQGDTEVFTALQQNKIKFAVARELNKCPSEKYRRFYLQQAIDLQASARQVAVWRQNTPIETEAGLQLPESEQATPVSTQPAAEAPCCAWCSDSAMPYNMVSVYLHNWCKQQMEQVLRQTQEVSA